MINDPKDTSLTVDCSRQGWEEYIHIQSAPKKKGQTAECISGSLDLEQLPLRKCGPEPVASAGPVGNADREGPLQASDGDFDAQAS